MDEIVIEQYYDWWFGNVVEDLLNFGFYTQKSNNKVNIRFTVSYISKNEGKNKPHNHHNRIKYKKLESQHKPRKGARVGNTLEFTKRIFGFLSPVKQGLKPVRYLSHKSSKTRMRNYQK